MSPNLAPLRRTPSLDQLGDYLEEKQHLPIIDVSTIERCLIGKKNFHCLGQNE